MILDSFFRLTKEIITSGRIKDIEIQGLSNRKIHEFEQQKRFKFPKSYTEFLSFCGESGAYELTGLDFNLRWDESSRITIAMQALDEGSIVPVIYKQSVFFSGDGHGSFYYFVSDCENDDPEVFRWDDYSEVRLFSKSFSSFVFEEALSYDLIKQKYQGS